MLEIGLTEIIFYHHNTSADAHSPGGSIIPSHNCLKSKCSYPSTLFLTKTVSNSMIYIVPGHLVRKYGWNLVEGLIGCLNSEIAINI